MGVFLALVAGRQREVEMERGGEATALQEHIEKAERSALKRHKR